VENNFKEKNECQKFLTEKTHKASTDNEYYHVKKLC